MAQAGFIAVREDCKDVARPDPRPLHGAAAATISREELR